MKKFLTILLVLLIATQVVNAKQQEPQLDYHIQHAINLHSNNQIKEALDELEKSLSLDDKNSDVFYLRSQIYKETNDYSSALTDINNAIKYYNKKYYFPKSWLYWQRAIVYCTLEKYDVAETDFETALKFLRKQKDEENIIRLLHDRAQMYYELNQYNKSDADYKLILKYDEGNQMAMVGLAVNLMAQKQITEAIKMLSQVIVLNESYSNPYMYRAIAYAETGDNLKAINDVFKYFELVENLSQYSTFESIVASRSEYALSLANSKIRTESDNALWKLIKLQILKTQKDYTSAITLCNELEAETGKHSYYYTQRSNLYLYMEDFENALSQIHTAIELEGETPELILQKADIYDNAGDYDNAIRYYTKYVEFYPTYGFSYMIRGITYYMKDDKPSALKDMNMAIELDGNNLYYNLWRGKLYRKLGDTDKAKKDLEIVLELDTVPDSNSQRQFALLYLDRHDEALKWMDEVIENSSDSSEISGDYYNKACLLSVMGRKNEAIATLKEALEKGYYKLRHMALDEELDNVRNEAEYIDLINMYTKYEVIDISDVTQSTEDSVAIVSEIDIKKMYSGIYEVPCSINGLPLKFIFDTGASTVSISSIEAMFMLKNGYLSESDVKGKEYYTIATGEIAEGTIIVIPEIKIGEAYLRNIRASVVHNQKAPLLLGQSVLERFGTITIDNINSKLIIKQ